MSKRERSLQQHSTIPQRKKTPSFSSSLLDSIYTDEYSTPHHRRRDSAAFSTAATTTKKHDHSLKRAIMIEEWIEKQNPASSASLSDSSSAAAGFTKTTKLRALKIYGELKKVKQPISPGGRISTFLNSIFNSKKAKMCYAGAVVDDVTFKKKSASCSSASSFSRTSCMTTKAAEDHRSRRSIKRSVRFYPVSVIIGEDSRPCGHKPLYYDDDDDEVISNNTSSLMAVKKKKKNYVGLYDEEEDTESCASSDLFELDHLIGIGRYRDQELPVYETTCLKKNHAIATGFNL